MKIGNKIFDTENTAFIMGILNVTPDSFSDGGSYDNIEEAIAKAGRMADDGADIIDIGGESTRPGHIKISDEEEIDRVVPVIERIKRELDITISVDTCKSKVARAAIAAGADMINDIWGLKYDTSMAGLISKTGTSVCIMHNRDNKNYLEFLNDVKNDIIESINIAKAHNIPQDRIMLDPGVGFAKSAEQNLSIINQLDILKEIGYPILLGTSRKSVIGVTLDLPISERMEGTLATSVIGALRGASFFRVHDVKENRRAVDMTMAIINS